MELELSGKTMAAIAVSGKSQIPRLGEVALPVTLTPSIADIGAFAGAGIKDIFGGKKQALSIQGQLTIRKFLMSKKLKFKEEIKW